MHTLTLLDFSIICVKSISVPSADLVQTTTAATPFCVEFVAMKTRFVATFVRDWECAEIWYSPTGAKNSLLHYGNIALE